ncbi:hypothetical protein QE375_003529 [Microbacterium foliorum]|uniref:Uncharacterized protein n=1 Tax=Microbacterium foliorum TaxID=104336 RepID=A0ABU1HV88_9MICO|nr:hypothetical protein [Microbacterium foliorum]
MELAGGACSRRDDGAPRHIALGILCAHSIGVRAAGGDAGVDERHSGETPVGGLRSRGGRVDRRPVDPVTDHLVLEELVVAVPVQRPGHTHSARGDRSRGGHPGAAAQPRPVRVRRLLRRRETHETLLDLVVDAGELPRHHDVVRVAGNAPRCLGRPAHRAGVECRIPVEQSRSGVSCPVRVSERQSVRSGSRDGVRERDRAIVSPGVALRETTDHALAVMGVSDAVHGVWCGVGAVGVTMAVLDPGHTTGRPVALEDALEIAASAECVSGSVEAGAVGGQRPDRAVFAAVSHDAVGREREQTAVGRIDQGHAVPGVR